MANQDQWEEISFEELNLQETPKQQGEKTEDEERPVNLSSELTSDYSIKWQTEIDLHRLIDTTIILEGNVNDEQVYKSSDGSTTMSSIENYLYDYLHSIGYETVIFFNHIEGFYNRHSEEEYKNFFKITKKAQKEEEGGSDRKDFHDADSSLFGEALRDIRLAMANKHAPVAIVMCDVSRYIASPNTISESNQFFYSKLSLATKAKKNLKNGLHNMLFLIAEKTNDIPAWFYLNNPKVKTITIPVPDMNIRSLYIDCYYDSFSANPSEETEEDKKRNKDLFVNYTEGFRLIDLESLRTLMESEELSVSQVAKAVSKFKYGIDINPWEDEDLRANLNGIEEKLKERVKGQDSAVHKAATIIKSAVLGLAGLQHSSSKSKPRGVMFLAGPTGVGKTELAKAISEWIFKSDSHVIRFDMSEYSQSHSDQRLLGAPPGYVGYEQGGQLTEAVKRDPFSVLLFDEIEKAHPLILDKFLQILEDGRMTDGKGETVYFSDTLIVFTSNLGMYREERTQYGMERVPTVAYGDDGCNESDEEEAKKKYEEYSKRILAGINNYFTVKIERPEIKNRIGENFIVFDYISYKAAQQIAAKQFNAIQNNLKDQKNIILTLSKDAQRMLIKELVKEEHMSQGGRGVGNVVENMIIRPLSNYMVDNQIWENGKINIRGFEENKGSWSIICDD